MIEDVAAANHERALAEEQGRAKERRDLERARSTTWYCKRGKALAVERDIAQKPSPLPRAKITTSAG